MPPAELEELAPAGRLHCRTPAERAFVGALRWRFRPMERLRPSEWIEKHIRLPASREQDHGPVRFDRIPFAREVLDALTAPGLTDVLFAGPTRICKTFLLRMAFCYKVAAEPGPMLLIDSTVPKARNLIRKEFMPLVECNPILRARKPTGRDRHDYATQQMLFPGASLNVYGANSEAQVSGDTCEVVLCNEAKDYRPANETTASTLDLIRHRTESYEDSRRHLISSAPKFDDDDFWLEMEKGDMRRYFVPCRDCGHFQDMRWSDEAGLKVQYRVWWDPGARQDDGRWDLQRVIETARYVCANPACGSHWDDRMRLESVWHPTAHWQATQTAQPGFRSFSIVGPYGWRKSNRIGELAADFLRARSEGFIANRQDWWNNRWGLPYRVNLAAASLRKLAHLEGSYIRGQLPAGARADLVIVGVDVQRNRFPYVVRACAWSGESWLLDHGEKPAQEDIEQVQEDYRLPGATSFVVIDINYAERRQEVKEWIHRNAGKGWMAADGVDYSARRVQFERENVFEGGKLQVNKEYIRRLVISTWDFKVDLMSIFTGQLAAPWWTYHLELAPNPVDESNFLEYKRQLLDEKLKPRKRLRKGVPKTEFVAATGNNHAFDCEVYIRALFWILRAQKTARELATAERAKRNRSIEVRR